MEYEVLKYLVDSPRRMVRVSDIAETLRQPKERVERAIEGLLRAGYAVERGAAEDVRLTDFTDVLDRNSIRLMLSYKGLDEDVVFRKETGSTNTDAKLLAQSGFCGIVAAETQTAGRGRRGKSYASEPGGLYFSYVKHPSRMTAADMQKVVLLVGVGICDTLEELGLSPRLKWPNDVCLNGKKVSGVLSEMLAEDNRVYSLILGVGVNLNNRSFPEELEGVATSCFLEAGRSFLRAEVLVDICRNVLKYEVSSNGYGDVLHRYRGLSNTLGRDVYIIEDHAKYRARAVDIDDAGFLMVETEHGLKRVVSADVSIR